MTQNLSDLTQALLSAARKAGADGADAVAFTDIALSAEVRDGQLEQAERAEGTDIGLRVFVGQQQASVSASDTGADTITAMAERAVAMAREAPSDPYAGLADPSQLAQNWDIDALELADPADEPDPAALQADALEAEAAALENTGISQVDSSGAGYSCVHIQIAATNGFSAGYTRTGRSTSCVAIAGKGLGMERDYDGDSRTFQSDLRAPSDIGATAARRAVERLGARKAPTGTFPVLFDERISASLVGHLLAAANGSAIARGSSWLLGKDGATVLPDDVDLIEDPHRPRATGSAAFDGEGLPTHLRKIVDQGVLTGWTLDLANARKLGMDPTGNAGRGVSSPPGPRTWNVAMTQGHASQADLIRDMGTGLLVTSMIGSTINPNTGDYSRGAAGLWIENGEIAYPVNESTVAGSLPQMLRRLVPANDARPWLSRVVPSVLIDGMTLAGS